MSSNKVEGSFLAYMLMDNLKSIGDPRLQDAEFINNRVDECCAAFERDVVPVRTSSRPTRRPCTFCLQGCRKLKY